MPKSTGEKTSIIFIGDTNNNEIYAIQLRKDTFFQTIPKKFSYEGKYDNFLIAPASIQDGSFNALYEQLTNDHKVKIKGACHYFMYNKNIERITSLKSPLAESGKSKSTKRVDILLSATKISEQIKELAKLCFEATNRVYVKDVQSFLNASGYDVGINDGQWGKKSQSGWESFLTDQGKPLDTAINAESIQELVARLNGSLPKLRKMNFRDGFFDTESELKKHTNDRRSLCKYIDCELTLKEKLEARKTINPFKAWDSPGTFGDVYEKHYGLYWTVNARAPSHTLTLNQINWAFNYPRFSYDDYPGVQKFTLNTPWGHDAEYGETYAIDLNRSDYAKYMASVAHASINANKADGIMLDWWHDEHPTTLTQNQIRKAREKLLIEYRKLDNNKTIILGNVNDRTDLKFAKLTNGVFLEHWKKPFKQYSKNQLFNMENTLEFFDKNLLEPKIIAFNVWKKSERGMSSQLNRKSENNKQHAKLFTAMSVVIPKNGYILFGDNNQDEADSDHNHDYYDFYSFDIGKPTSGYNKVKSGVGYKEHDRGFIAYNITGSSKKFKRKNGQEHTIEAKSGLFCKDVGAKTECLSNN